MIRHPPLARPRPGSSPSGRFPGLPAAALAALLLLGVSPVGLEAQRTRWWAPTAVGFGAAGAGLATMAAWAMEFDQGWMVSGVGTLTGVVTGALVGGAADRTLARGEELGPAHRGAVVGATVLAGAALGGAASALLINGEGEGTPLGSDEATFTLLTLAGAAAGGYRVWAKRDDLGPRRVGVAPTLDARGRPGARMTVRFR